MGAGNFESGDKRAANLRRVGAARLYGIVDLGYVRPEGACHVAEALVTGGAGIVQLRAKSISTAEILPLARDLLAICRDAEVPFIVNDFPDIAAEVGADGVHIGQDDGPLSAARARIGKGMIVGRSTHSLPQARAALEEGFDYIGFGPVYPTPTKAGRPSIGLESIREMERLVGSRIPAFCIGGIVGSTLPAVVAAGARRIVVVSAILRATDPAEAARSFLANLPGLQAD